MQKAKEESPNERLFAYGTLMFAAVVQAVLGRRVVGRPARLEGFVRRRVRGTIYPGIVPGPGSVTGVVYDQLSAEDWDRLDAFEGDEYSRRPVLVWLEGIPQAVPCYTYVYRPELADRLEGEWSGEGLEAEVLQQFAAARRNRR